MAVAFSTDGEDVINTSLLANAPGLSSDVDDVVTRHFLHDCVAWITKHNFKRVALQLPDEWQCDAAEICQWLQMQVQAQVFILADTSYGSCCVDEVACEHYNADSVIHFGRTCLSPTRRLPSLHVLGRAHVHVLDCKDKVTILVPERDTHLVLLYHVAYYHAICDLKKQLEEYYTQVTASLLKITDNCSIVPYEESLTMQTKTQTGFENEKCSEKVPDSNMKNNNTTSLSTKQTPSNDTKSVDSYAKGESCDSSETNDKTLLDNTNAEVCNNSKLEPHSNDVTVATTECCNRVLPLSSDALSQCTALYVGPPGVGLTFPTLMLHWTGCRYISYNPVTRECRREGAQNTRALMRRYALVEKAKDAQIVGIVVGTLGVANYMQIIHRIKALLKKVGKKSYTFVMGKLNVAKLANFLEIDIYVLVACPENSLLDSTEFYRPVITPYELELACMPGQEWRAHVQTDFQSLLAGGADHVALPEGDVTESHDLSLATGRMRTMGVREHVSPGTSELVSRDTNTQLITQRTAVTVLSERTWSGLEAKLGQTPVTKALQGRRGVAIGYEEEPGNT